MNASITTAAEPRWARMATSALIVAIFAGLVVALVLIVQVGSDVDSATSADVDRGRAVSEQNRTILDRIEEDQAVLEAGVEAVERGYLCLVALLMVPPADRAGIDPERFAEVCLVDLADAQLIAASLEAGP